MGKRHMSPEDLRKQRIQNFWKRVDVAGSDDCWLWKAGAATRRGYGMMYFHADSDRGKCQLAHRFSYEVANGPIPKGDGAHGTVIAHRCDNRRCVNPAHLFACTQGENLRDCLDKGRGNKAFGENAGRAKLTEAQAKLAISLAAEGLDRLQIAARLNVVPQTVHDVVMGKTWKHLPRSGERLVNADREYNNKPNSGSFKPGSKGNPGRKPEKRTIDYLLAVRLKSEGHSVREVARRMNTTHTTVRRALSQVG
jgi:hypothetical protein